MRKSGLGLGLVLAGALAGTACSASNPVTAPADGGTNYPPDTGVPDGGADTAPPVDGNVTGPLGFTPSNVDLNGMDLSKVGDFVVGAASCSIDSDEKLTDCGTEDALAFKLMTQADGSQLAVYVARTITIPAGDTLTVQGPKNALVLVALDKIDIAGTFNAHASGQQSISGGHALTLGLSNVKGAGPGGGAAGGNAAGSGGGYCGAGGAGAPETGTETTGGPTYGNATLTPLVGGSSGGAGGGQSPGGGGGALQLVARNAISIAAGGVINVGGGGGGFGGGAAGNMQNASGAGSGGSILLEAATVTVAGTLAANGGGGGGGTSSAPVPTGADGSASATPAPGGVTNGISPGGPGSAAANLTGGAGRVTAGNLPGGGGGGAGRIRINTKSGAATIASGTISPATSTACATQGTLQ